MSNPKLPLLEVTSFLKRLFEIEGKHSDNSKGISFGGDPVLYYHGNFRHEFDSILSQMHGLITEVLNTVSFYNFRETVVERLRNCKKQEFQPSADLSEDLLDALLRLPIQPFLVITPIDGITYEEQELPFEFGKFKIYNYPLHRSLITEVYQDFDMVGILDWEQGIFLIAREVNARDHQKAIEIADSYFLTCENVLNFIIADSTNFNRVDIINDRFRSGREIKTLSKLPMHSTHSGTGHPWFVTILDDDFLNDSVNKKIWEIVEKEFRPSLEQRLLNSVEWVAKALVEPDKPKALLQFTIAIESLLLQDNGRTRKTLIRKGISDSLVALLGKSDEDKERISKTFKDLYSKRSAIVHGDDFDSISDKELNEAHCLAKAAILQLLT